MGDYIEGSGRDQHTLFPEILDDYITPDNPVRAIDAYVRGLDIEKLGFERSRPAETGRPGYDPRHLLALYIYGYVNDRRSSRKLERELHRNVELMWLLEKLQPDFKTIAEFRRRNLDALRGVFREFTLLCKKLDLFSAELVAIDGSKFRAVNARRRNFSRQTLEKILPAVQARIDTFLQEIEQQDQTDLSTVVREDQQKKLGSLRQRAAEVRAMLAELDRTGETQISRTDGESRSMKVRVGNDVCFNAQSAVDEKHKLIVAVDVTNEGTDRNWLTTMALQAKEALGVEALAVVADKGYSSAREVKACLEHGITPYVPKPETSANKELGLFVKDDFRYDAEADTYKCPAGQTLTFRGESVEKGRPIRWYRTAACKTCPIRSQCTRSQSRKITRHADEAVLEEMQRRVEARPDILRKRKAIVEHPFGTMKRPMMQDHFLMKGLKKVRCEFSLSALAYNFKRVIAIVGTADLLRALA